MIEGQPRDLLPHRHGQRFLAGVSGTIYLACIDPATCSSQLAPQLRREREPRTLETAAGDGDGLARRSRIHRFEQLPQADDLVECGRVGHRASGLLQDPPRVLGAAESPGEQICGPGGQAGVLDLRTGQIMRRSPGRDRLFVASQRVERLAQQQRTRDTRLGQVGHPRQALARGVVAQHKGASSTGQHDVGFARIAGLDSPRRHAEQVVWTQPGLTSPGLSELAAALVQPPRRKHRPQEPRRRVDGRGPSPDERRRCGPR